MPEALFKNIYRRSNIGVVQRCIQVPQGGTGSSVTAGEHKREIPAASQRAMPPASLSYFHSHSHTGPWTLDPARPETEVQTKLDLRVGGERTHLGPEEERRQPFRHKKHLPLPTPGAHFCPAASAFIYLGAENAFNNLGCDHWGWECGQGPAGLTLVWVRVKL